MSSLYFSVRVVANFFGDAIKETNSALGMYCTAPIITPGSTFSFISLCMLCGLCPTSSADSRRNVKNALCYFVFKEHRGNRKAPSLSMPKSKGADNLKFLNFNKFFQFIKNSGFAFMYCGL